MVRRVLVTGSASGIGAATRARLEQEGTRVMGVDLHDAEVTGDLSLPAGRAAVVETVTATTPALDAVVCCAGVDVRDPVTVSVNYFGVVEILTGLRPLLARGTEPRAVAVASVAALHPSADAGVVDACLDGDEPRARAEAERALADTEPRSIYAASKRALCHWVRRNAVTADWAGAGIPLNAVAPGIVRTPMVAHHLSDDARRTRLEQYVPMPLHGPAEPEHVAAPICWLAGAENVLVTGQVVFVDGGADAVLRGEAAW
jgi:NAD(P)-dependent dehydrogenase (short-subunit alcohol dehydrogenase family)